jgi:hypothetical protein
VVTEALTNPHVVLHSPQIAALGASHKQLNSSVGVFGTAALQADTAAIQNASKGDATYLATVAALTSLDSQRDHLAQQIKDELWAAEFAGLPIINAVGQTRFCKSLLDQATALS